MTKGRGISINGTIPAAVPVRGGVRHVIRDVRFQQTADQGKPSSAAPLLCSCGEVTTSGQWDEHSGRLTRQEAGKLGGRPKVAA